MENIENIEALEELISIYKKITFEYASEKWYSDTSAQSNKVRLTGFGDTHACILCKVINKNCDICVHNAVTHLKERHACVNHSTYDKLSRSANPAAFSYACLMRVDYLERVLKYCRNEESE